MNFPSKCLRGLSTQESVSSQGRVTQHAFFFKKESNNSQGQLENSVNWFDDDGVIQLSHLQTRADGQPQFKFGLALFSTDQLNFICNQPHILGKLMYERAPMPDNKYHGNLLLDQTYSDADMKTLAGFLAAISTLRTRSDDGF